MAGRLPWILAGAAAIVGGMIVQDREWISFDDRRHEERITEAREARDEARRLKVTVAGEQRGEVDSETVRAMTKAVGELVRAEAALAIAEAGNNPEEVRAARARRDGAKALVDKTNDDIRRQAAEPAEPAEDGSNAAREAIRQQVREEVRSAVRN